LIEQRRLVRLGRSTLVVSLPADWVKKKGLKAGDVLTLVIDENFIKIVPHASSTSSTTTVVIKVVKRAEGLYRAIIASYIAGADMIRVEFEDSSLLLQVMKQIKMAINHLIGLEVVEQKPNYIVLQAFIGTAAQEPEELMKRIVGLIALMLDQLIKGEVGEEYLDELESEIDKLYRLALRTINASPEPDVLMVNLLTSLETASDTLIPMAKVIKEKRKEVLDILNIVLETINFLLSYEKGSNKIDEIDEKISVLEMMEGELEKRETDEKIKYRILLFIHNLKNALLMLHNMEIVETIRKSRDKVLVI